LLWILASNRAQVGFEILRAHRCELFAFGRLRHGDNLRIGEKVPASHLAAAADSFGASEAPKTENPEKIQARNLKTAKPDESQ
jgi:hypothetical protein